MKVTTILASASSLAGTVQAADVTTSLMTLEYPGYTHTIPVGLDTSSTQTITGWTVTGTATIVSGVAVITDATAVYMENLSNTGNNAKGGIGAQNTNILGGVTVIGGTIQGLESATPTGSSAAATKASSTGGTSSAATAASDGSTTSSSGVSSRSGRGQAATIAGIGAAVIAVVFY